MYESLKHGKILQNFAEAAEEKIRDQWREIDRIVDANQWKVLQAFQAQGVRDYHFHGSTGYGYDDIGRQTLEDVYARVFGAEAALVRPQIISGTHAITIALFGLLRPGDELLYVTGRPYDTLKNVVEGEGNGSLKDFGISFQAVDLKEGKPDYEEIGRRLRPETKVVGIQRSCGYAERPSLHIREIEEVIRFVKEIKPDAFVFVDNCYGEFVETKEPCEAGADLIAGSLIKNPGGGLAKTGGYLAGKERLIRWAANRMTAPGIGAEAGATLQSLHDMYMGLFLAPHIVGQALKGAVFTAALLSDLGFHTRPSWRAPRTDLIQSVTFKEKEPMIAFCQGIQKAAPVDSDVVPSPGEMPGYDDDVIMAAGTFIQGSSIELSADGPVREPYLCFVQGGLTYSHVKIALLKALDHMLEQGCLTLNDRAGS